MPPLPWEGEQEQCGDWGEGRVRELSSWPHCPRALPAQVLTHPHLSPLSHPVSPHLAVPYTIPHGAPPPYTGTRSFTTAQQLPPTPPQGQTRVLRPSVGTLLPWVPVPHHPPDIPKAAGGLGPVLLALTCPPPEPGSHKCGLTLPSLHGFRSFQKVCIWVRSTLLRGMDTSPMGSLRLNRS